ncbi:MAG: TIGR02186 family protein [Rhodospirillales bacterium]|nr:TIGR02186 family protein [Rhodospirillales bacterium]
MRTLISSLTLTVGLLFNTSLSLAEEREHLVVDLSAHQVEITAGFNGAELLLFGATGGKGDVVVVVRGPTESTIVRRKDKKGGIWVNGENMRFDNVPGFYAIAATRKLDAFLPWELAKDKEIGTDFLTLVPHNGKGDAVATRNFRDALIRTKKKAGLYANEVSEVSFLGNLLFRTDIKFPANVPVGKYSVDVYLIRGLELVEIKNTPLVVKKIGIEAGIFYFAKHHALAYGIFAVLIAAFAGWLAGVIFKKK